MNESENLMTKQSITKTNPRIAQNLQHSRIEQSAASDLETSRRARIRGEEPTTDYVPLWKRV